MITEWWTSLDLFMKILWCIAIATSLTFIIQSILTFVGVDSDTDLGGGIDTDLGGGMDMNPDFVGDPSMNLFTFRNLVNFFLGFSWTAILMHGKFRSEALVLLLAFFVGAVLVTVVMLMFKWLAEMQQSGNIDVYKSAVGCHGKVYLTIPGERKGTGKVQIVINESVREYDAITDCDTIATGAQIKVVEVIDSSTLLVEPLESLII